MDLQRPLKLVCTVQNYPWGRRGPDSLVAQLAGRIEDRPFAELWAGAHPKSCSTVRLDDGATVSLQQLIADAPEEFLGRAVYRSFGAQLPFLFKILSVARPLSIQLHPDSAHAPVLHQRDPANYPDSNSKPEIAIALTEVSLLFGFRSLDAVHSAFARVPELGRLHGGPLEADASLRAVHERLLRAPEETVRKASSEMYRRLASTDRALSPEEQWVLSLQEDFPEGDIGLFYFYLLNLVTLKPGEAVFIRPNVPHAYLAGDLAECLANSDNVIRAGLTPKHKDVESLLELADFTAVDSGRLEPKALSSAVRLFSPPVREFSVELHEGEANESAIAGGELNLLFSLSARGALRGPGFDLSLAPRDVFVLPASIARAQLIRSGGLLFRIRVP